MAPKLNDKKPKAGDLIEIFRGKYQHWAVYVGDGFIVHITSTSDVAGSSSNSMMSVRCEKALVKKEKLSDVVGKHRWRINNILDKKHDPRSAHVIVKEAEAKVGEAMKYNAINENCEHFATKMRYGEAESRQVVNGAVVGLGITAEAAVVTIATIVAGAAGLAGAAAGLVVGIGYMIFDSKKKNKNKK